MKLTHQLLTYIRPYRLWLAGAFLLILSTSLAIKLFTTDHPAHHRRLSHAIRPTR